MLIFFFVSKLLLLKHTTNLYRLDGLIQTAQSQSLCSLYADQVDRLLEHPLYVQTYFCIDYTQSLYASIQMDRAVGLKIIKHD